MSLGDPGSEIDDGFAIALLLADSTFKLELITTVHGNTDSARATSLSHQLLERLNRTDIPVVSGASGPATPLFNFENNGRKRSQAGFRRASSNPAAKEIINKVMCAPGEITILAIGPLTNIADAIILEPQLYRAVREIVIMGGVFFEHTNQSERPGEFNIWKDPIAARTVFRSNIRPKILGLDVTKKVRLHRREAENMINKGSAFGVFAGHCVIEWINRTGRLHQNIISPEDSCALHDPLAVAAISKPQIISWVDAHVDCVIDDPVGRGITVADLLTSHTAPKANAKIAVDVNVDSFMDYFFKHINSL